MIADFVTILMSLGVGISLLLGLLLCVCGKVKQIRNENHTEDNLNNNEKQEEVELRRRSRNGLDQRSRSDRDDSERVDSVRPKTLTINRKLPEIPHLIATNNSRTDLYATVDEVAHKTTQIVSNANESSSRQISTHKTDTKRWSQSSKQPITLSKYEEPHSYAKLRGQTSDDRDTDGETYSDPQLYSNAETNGVRSWDATLYEPPPPVPDKNYEPGAGQHEQQSQSPNSLSLAASAVSGNSSIVDIPFMTSPVPPIMTFADDSDTYSNTLKDFNYTSISVREPLANIRAQMVRQEAEAAAAAAAASALSYPESHYSIVPEDADQMYAEIESAQNSTTSSVTYNVIGPPDAQPSTSTHYPPAPPTVESLRTVAQAHSRHASSSSCISDSSYPNSPVTERSFVLNRSTSPDFSGMYSTVDKTKKARSTVHVMEKEPGHHSVEEMYAKVKKTRPQTMKIASTFGDDGQKHSSAVLKIDEPSGSSTNIVRRQSSSKEDPGYEKIRDRKVVVGNEESVIKLSNLSDFDLVEIRRKTVTLKSGYSGDTDSDPGYEVVKSEKTFPGYETIKEKFDEVSEHGYEKVNKINDDEDRGIDPGYERVGDSTFSRSDPNYESVHYSNGKREDTDTNVAGLPQYWQIRGREETDPLYERINSQEDDQTDPNYEKVKTVSEISYDTSDPGYERVGQGRQLGEDGYERIHDRLCDQVDPGYELITEKREWKASSTAENLTVNGSQSDSESGPDDLYSVPMRPFSKRTDKIIRNEVIDRTSEINQTQILVQSLDDTLKETSEKDDKNEFYIPECGGFRHNESMEI